jgi:hypothetical protein
MFEMKTKVQLCPNNTIDCYGLSVSPIAAVVAYGADHDFLVG